MRAKSTRGTTRERRCRLGRALRVALAARQPTFGTPRRPSSFKRGRRPRTRGLRNPGGRRMRRIAGVIAALGLIAFGRAYAAEEKSETKTEHESDAKGSTTKVEKSSKHHGAMHDEKSTIEHKAKPGGKVETKKQVSKTDKPTAKAKKQKTEVKEKTVRDAQGNVVEQEKDKTVK